MSEGWNIAVLGATGAVGEALLETLLHAQRHCQREELLLPKPPLLTFSYPLRRYGYKNVTNIPTLE